MTRNPTKRTMMYAISPYHVTRHMWMTKSSSWCLNSTNGTYSMHSNLNTYMQWVQAVYTLPICMCGHESCTLMHTPLESTIMQRSWHVVHGTRKAQSFHESVLYTPTHHSWQNLHRSWRTRVFIMIAVESWSFLPPFELFSFIKLSPASSL